MSENTPRTANIGLNTDGSINQIQPGMLTYALNSVVQNFDGQQINYTNEQATEFCVDIPEGFKLIGSKNIQQKEIIILWLVNPTTKEGRISQIYNCTLSTIISGTCLNFDINYPILKSVVKTTNCSTQIYWTDGLNPRRFLDLDDLPWKEIIDPENSFKRIKLEGQLDCNKLNVQPDFAVPDIELEELTIGGNLTMGAYQLTTQYANSEGEGLTSFYSVTNPVGIFENKIGPDFNLPTSKAISVTINNLDTSGLYEYFNLVVVKTINNISSAELIGTFPIGSSSYQYTYTGTEQAISVNLTEIFLKFPYYDIAEDIFDVDNVVGWSVLKQNDEINYQKIWSKVKLLWETHKLPYNEFEAYTGVNTAKYRGYMRDEVYPFEGCFILANGKQTKSFHIPGREATEFDREIIENKDSSGLIDNKCDIPEPKQRWEVYNTGTVIGKTKEYEDNIDITCTEIIEEPNIPPTTSLTGSIIVNCNDSDCHQQGNTTLKFIFNSPTPETGLNLKIGFITDTQVGRKAAGYSGLFTIPSGVTADGYYNSSNPFNLFIPGGVTEFTSSIISNDSNIWVCHSCIFPVTELFIKNAEGLTLSFNVTDSKNRVVLYNFISTTPIQTPEPTITTICTDCYTGSYEYGEFGYWESLERYPNNRFIWGDLANEPIRHHKFPDLLVSPIHDNNTNNLANYEHSIYPIGVRVVMETLYEAIQDSDLSQEQKDQIIGFKIVRGNRTVHKSIIAKGLMTNVGKSVYDGKTYYYPNYPYNDLSKDPYFSSVKIERTSQTPPGYREDLALKGFDTDISRFSFHSPDTHFFQPSLNNEGEYLKLETIEYGQSRGHFVKVERNAEYKFLTPSTIYAAGGLAQASGLIIGAGTFGWPNYDMSAAIPTFTAAQELFEKLAPYTNFGYTFNSVGNYGNSFAIPNSGDKIRKIDFNKYLVDGINTGESGNLINNIRRESSVYIKTQENLLFPTDYDSSIPEDNSRYNLASLGDNLTPEFIRNRDISAYYGSIKKDLPSQWGQMYAYESIETGYFQLLNPQVEVAPTVFGGDIFINKMSYKVKQPIFKLNTVDKPNQTDIQGNEIGTINYPMFYISTKPANFELDIDEEIKKLGDEFQDPSFFEIIGNLFTGGAISASKAMNLLIEIIRQLYEKVGIKNINLDRQETLGITEQGIMYLFAYGIPTFFCESEVNVDFRQALNDREGNFYPNVGGDIPDDWLQEINVPIIRDNSYTYNKTYSKQNKENFFDHLKETFDPDKKCLTEFPNRAIWSDMSSLEENKNNWLVYRPSARYDFPKSYGKLVSLDGIENRQVLARFENKTLLYNALLTAPTSAANVYLGQTLFSQTTPPLDYAETDLGFIGSQNKMLLKTEYGHITIDAKRGSIFLIQDQRYKEISAIGMQNFFANELPFKILKYFPVNVDNNFAGIGLHAVYDMRYNRAIITKLDYEPLFSTINFDSDSNIFTNSGGEEILLTDSNYFCNRSFTVSYSFDTNSWTSFHSYLPNYYIGDSNIFYSGNTDIWKHNTSITKFCNFYDSIHPYVLEYPFAYKFNDEILQSVRDYTKSFEYEDLQSMIEVDSYFDKCILYNDQQCSGILKLTKKPVNNLQAYKSYPIYYLDSKEILYTKSDHFYQLNTFWSLVDDKKKPIWKKSCSSISEYKTLNQDNMSYSKRSYKKEPLRAKDLKVRLINEKDTTKLISQFILSETAQSYK